VAPDSAPALAPNSIPVSNCLGYDELIKVATLTHQAHAIISSLLTQFSKPQSRAKQ